MRIIDVHGHVGHWNFPIRALSVSNLQTCMQRCGIERTIVSHSSAITYDFIAGNKILADVIMDADDVWGYIVLNPHYIEESFGELAKYRGQRKFIGVKLHPEQHDYRLIHRNVFQVLERIDELRLPVLVHTFPEQTRDFGHMARRFTRVNFIMGHMGGNDWRDGIEAVADNDNVWLDPCCSFPDVGKISEAVKRVGAARVVFGSDSSLFNPAFVLGMLQDEGVKEDELCKIAWQNAEQIFQF